MRKNIVPQMRHHETRLVLNNQAENNAKRGTTFCKNTKPTLSKSMAYKPKSNFTVQVGLDWGHQRVVAREKTAVLGQIMRVNVEHYNLCALMVHGSQFR